MRGDNKYKRAANARNCVTLRLTQSRGYWQKINKIMQNTTNESAAVNSTNTVLIVIVLLLLVGGGVWYFTKNDTVVVTEPANSSTSIDIKIPDVVPTPQSEPAPTN